MIPKEGCGREFGRPFITSQKNTEAGGSETLTWPAWQEPVLQLLDTENITGFPDGPETGDFTPPKPLAQTKKDKQDRQASKKSLVASSSSAGTNDGETLVDLLVSATTNVQEFWGETSSPPNQEESVRNDQPEYWFEDPAYLEEEQRPGKRRPQTPLDALITTPQTAALS